MRVASSLVFVFGVVACTVQTPLGPPVTCPDVSLEKSAGACDFVSNQVCSDSHFYFISCQDDGTCTCTQDTDNWNSFLAADGTTAYCSTLTDASSLRTLAMNCLDPKTSEALNINP